MSTISASTTSTTAYKVTADTTGTLVLQTGSTPTTALTLGTGQQSTFAGRLYVGAISSALANENILTGGQGGGIQLIRNASTNPSSGDSLGSVAWKGVDSANTNAAGEAMIEAVAAENQTGSTAATNLLFHTKPTGVGPGSSPYERMRLTSGGSLLVGTTSTSGSISLSNGVVAGSFKTFYGQLTQSGGGAWYDAFTLTNEGLYIVHCFVGGYNAGPSDWSNGWFISYTGANNAYVGASVFGAVGNVQCQRKAGTQTIQFYLGAGAGVTYTYAVQRIA